MSYDAMVISAHPDDAEVQMGGTIAKLTDQGFKVLIVDLCNGEPTDYAEPGIRTQQAEHAAKILGADRLILDGQDRFIQDTVPLRLELARLIRTYQPRWVFGTTDACIHPDHEAGGPHQRAAIFYARLQKWEDIAGAEMLAGTSPWIIERLFFPHCKMEPAWGNDFHFAIDVSCTYERKKLAMAAYQSIFTIETGDRLLDLYEAEDMHMGGCLVSIMRRRSEHIALCW